MHLESMKVCSTSLPFSPDVRRRCTTLLNRRASSVRALRITTSVHWMCNRDGFMTAIVLMKIWGTPPSRHARQPVCNLQRVASRSGPGIHCSDLCFTTAARMVGKLTRHVCGAALSEGMEI